MLVEVVGGFEVALEAVVVDDKDETFLDADSHDESCFRALFEICHPLHSLD